MLHRLFPLVGLLLLSTVHASRTHAEIDWELGFKGGLGLGRVSGDTQISETLSDPDLGDVHFEGDSGSFQGGGVGGAYARAQFSPRFAMQMEFFFAEKGGRGDMEVTVNGTPSESGELTYEFSYVEIPILAIGSFALGERTSVDVFGGAAFAHNTSGTIVFAYEGKERDVDVSDDISGTDLGVTLGAAFSLDANEELKLHFGARYTMGLIDIPDSEGSLKNHYLAFMFGLGYPIGEGE